MLKKSNIQKKITVLIVFCLIIFVLITNLIVFNQFKSFVKTSALHTNSKLSLAFINEKYKGDWSVKFGALYKGDHLINYDTKLVDLVKNSTGADCTIYLKDTSVSTTITKSKNRYTGYSLEEKITDKTLKENKEFLCETDILSKTYQAVYLPLTNESGENIGILFLGLNNTDIFKDIMPTILLILLMTFIVLIFIIFLLTIVCRNMIILPVRKNVDYLNLLSTGKLNFEIDEYILNKNDEIGDISKAILKTKNSLNEMISMIINKSDDLNLNSSNLSKISFDMDNISSSINTSIVSIADGSKYQSNDLDAISKITDVFGEQVDSIAISIKEINKTASDMGDMANDSSANMDNLTKSITEIGSAFNTNSNALKMMKLVIFQRLF